MITACPKCQNKQVTLSNGRGLCQRCEFDGPEHVFKHDGSDFNRQVCMLCGKIKPNDESWKCKSCWDFLSKSGAGYHDSEAERLQLQDELESSYT